MRFVPWFPRHAGRTPQHAMPRFRRLRAEQLEDRRLLTGVVSGMKWNDLDDDGVRDTGEPGLGGVQVYADKDLDGSLDPGEPYAFTLSDGTYQLTLTPGTYTIREVVPTDPWNWEQTAPADGLYTVTVLSGQTVTDCDFGNHLPTGTISGTKWNDLDNDGVRDIGEPGLGGVQVYVDANNDGVCGTGEKAVFTASDGSYSFALEPGTYTIRETVPNGWTQTAPAAGHYSVSTTDGETVSGCDFANSDGIKVTGAKWEDLDVDGVRDLGEAGLGGFQIYADLDANGQYDSGEPAAFTASDGRYRLFLDANQTYTIRETQKDGWLQTAPQLGYYTVTGTSGETITGCDFANVSETIKVTGVKWEDLDLDGARDTGEAGLGGFQIYADLDNDGSYDSGEPAVFTASDGTYHLFLDAPSDDPVTYTIREALRAGEPWVQTAPQSGSYTVEALAGTVATGCDFGNAYQAVKIVGAVWEDLNHDGRRDTGEAGLDGFLVYADLDNSGSYDSGEPAAFTATDGTYQLILPATAADPDTYTIRETLPSDAPWLQTAPAEGSYTVDAIAGTVVIGCDFGDVCQVLKVTGVKWEDLDYDGVRDLGDQGQGGASGEAGLGGWQIYADLNNDGHCGAGEPYVFTAPDGSYELYLDASQDAPGSYVIRETQKDLWLQTAPTDGYYTVETVAGSVATGCNFGNVYQAMKVTGVKWEDLNHDRVHDTAEAGLGGVRIYADLNNDGLCGTGEPYVFTQSDGSYQLFLNASATAPDSYTIREVVTDGWVQTVPTDGYYTVATAAGATHTGCDFGNAPVGVVTGVKWEDLDQNGQRDTGEAGLGGVQIYADLNNDGLCGTGEPYVFTQSDGSYRMVFTTAGTYTLREVLQEGWRQSAPTEGYFSVAVDLGSTVTGCGFGNYYVGVTIRGVKWEDLDQDGVRDTGEAGLGGWQIYVDLNNDDAYAAGEPYVFTLADGSYTLQLDESGTYFVREVLKAGWTQSAPAEGYYTVVAQAGSTTTGCDFGNYYQPPSVSGVKWNDLNGDGVHDANEPGLSGVQIYADLNNDGRCGAGEPYVFTQSDGSYTLEFNDPGSYLIREVVPDGWHQTYPTSGSHSLYLDAGEVATGVDFGNIDGLVIGYVWNDNDGDGVWDPDESGLADWQVYADINLNGCFDTGEPDATTAIDGSYRLVLSDGTYTLRETLHAGWQLTAPATGSYALTLYTGLTITGCNFGNRATAELSTPGMYAPQTSTWYLRNSTSSGVADLVFGFGPAGAGWQPVVGDWDGAGGETVGLYDPVTSTWYLRNSNSTGAADVVFGYGAAAAGWTAVVGDWDGDGRTTVGLYDPATATWYLHNSNTAGTADLVFGYGQAGANWTPVVGDWDGDGRTSVGLYDAATATWYLRNSNSSGAAELAFGYGLPGGDSLTVVGDWNAAAGDSIGLVDSDCQWALRNTNSTGAAELMFGFGAAGAGWIPLAGNWGASGAALMAAEAAAKVDAALPWLTLDQLEPLVGAAIERFAAAGLEAKRLATLQSVQVLLTDLPGDMLGRATGNTIYLDLTAAGHGWFVDPTPGQDEEFNVLGSGALRSIDPAAVDQIDLLTVVEHELGHVAGLEDLAEADHLMTDSLAVGVRRTVSSVDVDGVE